MGAARVIESNSEWALGAVGNIMVAIYRGPGTVSKIRRTGELLKEVTQEYPGNCCFLSVIEIGSKAPDNEARELARAAMKSVGKNLKCVAYVLEGDSMRATLARTVLAGISFFSSTVDTDFFSDIGRAERWMKSKLKNTPTNLAAEVENIRTTMK